jgi:hypothetical protein
VWSQNFSFKKALDLLLAKSGPGSLGYLPEPNFGSESRKYRIYTFWRFKTKELLKFIALPSGSHEDNKRVLDE